MQGLKYFVTSWLLLTSLTSAIEEDSPYLISTVAGSPTAYKSDDGIPALSAYLRSPTCVALDSSGNQYIVDSTGERIRKVDAITGIITAVVGSTSGGSLLENIPAVKAELDTPYDLVLDAQGNLFFSELYGKRIRKVNVISGNITTIAGTGGNGYSGDGRLATEATLSYPKGITLDRGGNLFIADSANDVIRRVDAATGIITTYAGTGNRRFYGENVPAIEAAFNTPTGVTIDLSGDLIISDYGNHCIRKVTASTGIVTTIAGVCGNQGRGFGGDGGPATAALLANPLHSAIDALGNMYIVDSSNNRIRMVSATTKLIMTVAGSGQYTSFENGIPALTSGMDPVSVTPDNNGNFYIADAGNHLVRFVSKTRTLTIPPSSAPTTSVPSPAPTTPRPTSSPSTAPTTATTTSLPSAAPSSLTSPSPAPTTASTTSLPSAAPSSLTVKPSSLPISTPTAPPTAKPSSMPISTPTAPPTAKPSSLPISTPTAPPTAKPSSMPNSTPTAPPTAKPSSMPISTPTAPPTAKPSSMPNSTPTATCFTPSSAPTKKSCKTPTSEPTKKPRYCKVPTMKPTRRPRNRPSKKPTKKPFSCKGETLLPTMKSMDGRKL